MNHTFARAQKMVNITRGLTEDQNIVVVRSIIPMI